MRRIMPASLVAGLMLALCLPTLSPTWACIATPPPQPDVMIPMPRDLPKRLSVVAGARITFALPHLDSVRVETTGGLSVRSKPGDGQLVIASDPYGGAQEATLMVEYRGKKWVATVELRRWVPPSTPPLAIDLTGGRDAPGETIGLTARTELEIRVTSNDGQVDVQFGGASWTPQQRTFDAAHGIFTGRYALSGIDRPGGRPLDHGEKIEVIVRARAGEERLQRMWMRPMPTPVC